MDRRFLIIEGKEELPKWAPISLNETQMLQRFLNQDPHPEHMTGTHLKAAAVEIVKAIKKHPRFARALIRFQRHILEEKRKRES
jgi:hypothetical protein